METIIEILKEVNIAQLLSMIAVMWFGYNRLDKKIDKMDAKFDKINERIDKLSEKIEDVDRRLCRIEGSLATKGHCIVGQKHYRKAQ